MDDQRTVVRGAIVISAGKIESILPEDAPLPEGITVVDTQGVIYPGLMNLHDHLAYDFLPVYSVDHPYGDRDQWPTGKSYDEFVNSPKNLLTDAALFGAGQGELSYALLMQVMGGTTAVQGAPPTAGYTGMVRNVEARNPDISARDTVGADVIAIDPNENPKAVQQLQQQWQSADAMFYHLAEGKDAHALQDYYSLKKLNLIDKSLVGIHCAALTEKEFEDWGTLTGEGPKVVWSPLSNLMLYGDTTDILAARRHGAIIALGTDWTPSGSKNLLWELKIADLYNQQQLNGALSDDDLVAMVTRNPAALLNWGDKVGQLKPGMVADLVVLDDRQEDPNRNLIDSVEHNVKLVVTGGRPVYGDAALMAALCGTGLEPIDEFTDRPKAVDLGQLPLPKGVAHLPDLVAQLDSVERFSPDALAGVLNTAQPGPAPFHHREAVKAWLVAQYRADKTHPAIPPALTDPTAEITADQVLDYLRRKYPDAQPLSGVIPLAQETDDGFFKAFLGNPNLSAALDLSGLETWRTPSASTSSPLP